MTAPALAAPPAAPSWRRRLAGRLAWNVVAEGLARGASLVLTLAAARLLGVEEYGRFVLALAAAQYAWLLADASANSGFATRELLAARRERPAEAAALTTSLLLARLRAAALLTIAAALALALAPAPLRAPFAAAGLSFITIALLPDWALRGFEDFRTLALAQAGAALLTMSALASVLPLAPTATMAAAIWALSFAAAALIAWVALSRDGRLSLARQRPALAHRRSLVFALGAVGGIACAQTPMLLAGTALAPHEAGLFGAVSRLLVAWMGAMAVLWWPLFGVLARETPGSAGHARVIAGSGQLALAAALPAALACLQWPHALISLLFGSAFVAAAPLLAWTGVLLPLHAMLGLLEQVALAHGHEHVRVRAYAVAFVLVLGLGLAGLPRLGALAPLLGLIAGFAAATGVYAWSLRHRLPARAMLHRALLPAAAALVLAALWAAAARLALPAVPSIAAGLVAYALAMTPLLRRAQAART